MLESIRKKVTGLDTHTVEVFMKSMSSTVVKVSGMLIGLLLSIFLGRTIQAEGLGIINLSLKITNIVIVVSLLGMRQVIIKEIAIAYNKNNYTHIGNVMYTSYWLNGTFATALTIILILITPWVSVNLFNEPRLTFPLIAALIAVTPQVFSRIFSSALIGYKKIWQSNLVENALSSAITSVLLLIHWLLNKEITVNIVAVYYAVGRLAVTIITGLYWNVLYKYKDIRKNIAKRLTKVSVPVFYASISSIIIANGDVIILGALSDSASIGLYSVAARLAFLTSFFLQVTNSSISPKIAALYENGNMKELEKMIKNVTSGLAIIGLVQFLVLLGLGKYILSLWGSEFINSYTILIILGFGQFVNIGTGAVGQILVMSGHEQVHKNILLIFLFINILLSIFLIWYWGVIGAACATATTYIGMNITRYIYIYKLLKIKVLF